MMRIEAVIFACTRRSFQWIGLMGTGGTRGTHQQTDRWLGANDGIQFLPFCTALPSGVLAAGLMIWATDRGDRWQDQASTLLEITMMTMLALCGCILCTAVYFKLIRLIFRDDRAERTGFVAWIADFGRGPGIVWRG
jgi:hypothetical protein